MQFRNSVEVYKIPFFDLSENFVIPNRYSAFKFKDFVKMYHSCAHGAEVQWKMLAYFLSLVFKQTVHFGSNPFGTKIIALCFIYFSRATFSSPLLSNLDIITSKIFPDHRQNLGFSWSFGSVVKYFVFTVLLWHALSSSSFSQS